MLHRRATLILMMSLLATFWLAGRARSALAQNEPDKAAANALFDDGKRLTAEGRYDEACTKFEASMALIPRLGVQLNLANCYEQLGKTASAWITFSEAAVVAHRMDDPREGYARDRLAALAPRLARLTITVADAAEGLEVRRDGSLVPASLYGVGVPVDPGEHTLEASAPGHHPWSTRVRLTTDGQSMQVQVPVLEVAPGPPRPVAAPPASAAVAPRGPLDLVDAPATPRHSLTPRAIATWSAFGIGAVGVGVGTYFGLSARSLWSGARPGCDAARVCADGAYDDAVTARRHGNFSTVAFAVGGVALATGAVLYLTTPREAGRSLRLAPTGSADSVGFTFAGSF